MASVPQTLPHPKEGEAPQPQPTSIAGLFGNLFSGSQAQAQSSAEPAALRGTNTEMAAKLKRAAPVRTASAPTVPHPRSHEAAPSKLDAVANNAPAPAPAPPVQQARDDQKMPATAPSPEMRIARDESQPEQSKCLLPQRFDGCGRSSRDHPVGASNA